MSKAILRHSERIYAFLLKFYPRRYRQEFGDEMRFVFSESLADADRAHGERGIFTLWTRTLVDTGKSLVIEHLENQTGSDTMKNQSTNILVQNRNILFIALATALLLLVPWTAMQFTNEVAWSAMDFIAAGVMLFGAGLAYELITRKAGNTLFVYRVAVLAAVGTGLLLLWANLAVGIVGSENNPANWLYMGVLVFAGIAALISRFQPQGMERAAFATALAQVIVTLFVMVFGKDLDAFKVVMVNGFFTVLWVGSALLFRYANAVLNRKPN